MGKLLLLLLLGSIATPASAQFMGGYGFGAGFSSDSNELPGPGSMSWRGTEFTSYNGECPPSTRREVMIVKQGKYEPRKKWPYQEWVSKKWKITQCTTLDFNHQYIPANNGGCVENTSYAGNGYCKLDPHVPYGIRPKDGKCPKGTKLTESSNEIYCQTLSGHEGEQDETISVDVIREAKF